MTKIKTLSFGGETIYCGVDIHKKNWKVAIQISEVISASVGIFLFTNRMMQL